MKCKLVGQNLRVFSKAVRLFSKLSNEVFIIANNNRIKMQSLNEYKTAFVEIQFENRFFSSYECNEETKCKLFMKSLILVFRILNIDKVVTSCTLIMSESMPKVIFEMKRKNGINREYFLPYMESSELRNGSDLDQINPSFKVNSKLLLECLQNFSNETKDISLWLTSEQILFKTYFDEIEEHNIMTSFAYKSREFQNYSITNEISVTFNLNDLKHFVEFSTFRDQNIKCYFEASGKPINFVVNTNENYSAKIMLATHDFPEDFFPVPPSLPHNSTQNQSSMSSGNLSMSSSAQPQSRSSLNDSNPPIHTPIHPQCILNTSTSNNSSDFVNPNNKGHLTEDEDPFPDEDENFIEDILSQMPDFSADNTSENLPSVETIANLSRDELQRYHTSVLCGVDEEMVTSFQDILVPDSDEEQ